MTDPFIAMLGYATLNALLINVVVLFWAFTFAYCYFGPQEVV